MGTRYLVIAGLISSAALFSSAWSWPDKSAQSRLAQTNSTHSNELILAHYFHKTDPRQTFAQYARSTKQSLKVVKDQFSATGTLKCFENNGGGAFITAEVVGRNDLITGAAHIFFNDDCTPRDIRRCEFRLNNQPKHVFKLRAETAVIKACTKGTVKSRDDWFVAELTEPTSATPYLVPGAPIIPSIGDRLVQIAAQAENGFRETPNIVACSVMNVSYRLAPYLTDCSTGEGASGAAQLQRGLNGRWILNAVVSQENPGGSDGGEFDINIGPITASAPVNGEFWQALADKLRGTPEAFEKMVPSRPSALQQVDCLSLAAEAAVDANNDYVFRGMVLAPLTREMCQQGMGRNKGVFVLSVVPGTPAFAAGVEAGDIIFELDDQTLSSLKEFEEIASAKKSDVPLASGCRKRMATEASAAC